MAQFQPGQSGNPSGRPAESAEVKALAREQTGPAMSKLVAIMHDPEASRRDQLAAATALLDRGWGKPTQAISGPDNGPLSILCGWMPTQ